MIKEAASQRAVVLTLKTETGIFMKKKRKTFLMNVSDSHNFYAFINLDIKMRELVHAYQKS